MVSVASSTTDTFASLIERGADAQTIASHLDGLDPKRRVGEVHAVGGALQKKLWDLVKGKGQVEITSFVANTQVTHIYEGKNSLLMFTRFQKRFYRFESGEIAGYNHNDPFVTTFVGPGYFTVEPSADGEILFDYTRYPKSNPPDWPAVRENKGMLAGVVYGGMQDYCRYVSKDTVIGAAFIGQKSRNSYFLLTRAV